METNLVKFPKLKGSNNYEIWSIRMEAAICEKGYLDVMTTLDLSQHINIETGQYKDEALVKELLANRTTRTYRAAAIIRLSLEDGPLIQTRGINDALLLWGRLKALYEPTGFSSEFLTCKELFSTTLAKCGNIMESYLTTVKRLTDDLATRNLAIPNKVIAAYTLNNLTPEYENTVAIISQSYRSEKGDIDLITLFSQLVDESRRIRAKEPTEMALNTHNQRAKTNIVKGYRPNRSNCLYCKKPGHTEGKCWAKNPNLRPKQALPSNDKGVNENPELSLICDDQALLSIGSESTWILDSAATSHICAYKDQFLSLTPCERYLNWGKAQRIKVNLIGDISLRFTSTGQQVRLTNVLFVPELGVNLLSTGKLIGKGVTVNSTPKACKLITSKGAIIAQGEYKGDMTLFSTKKTVKEDQAYISEDSQIWHHRMGHIGVKALKQLPKVTTGIEDFNDKVFNYLPCDTCIQAKATAIISREKPKRASIYLEKVHSDICGPISPETWSKSRYFTSFIDDKTRWAEISLLRSKDQLYDSLVTWLKKEENQTGIRLKQFHSDNAPEYKLLVKGLFAMKGILGTYSAPYTPQQNGTAEIFNRTIIAKVRAMLTTSGLPKAYWGEALTAAVYIYNRTPHSSLEGFITPYESRYGSKPNISNVKIWGSIAYKREPLVKKLDSRATLHLLIGYGSNQYKVAEPYNHKTQWVRDLYPIEGKFIRDLDSIKAKPGQLANNQLAKISDQLAKPDPPAGNQLDKDQEWLSSFTKELEAYSEQALPAFNEEPFNYKEVLDSKDKGDWLLAMNTELEELNHQNTWTLTDLPKDRKALKGRWVLKIKQPFNQKPIYKARWVAKGFQQRPGIDFNETYANTVNPISYRLLLALAAYKDWEIEQWDVKSAYPNASLTETVYVQQPVGFEDGTNRVCKLTKALYGLKQSAREWEQHFKVLANKLNLRSLNVDQSVYISKDPNQILILIVYVDDILAMSNRKDTVKRAYETLSQDLTVKDLGPINQFLGIRVTRDRLNKSIRFDQQEYTKKILSRFMVKETNRPIAPLPLGAKLEPNPDQATAEDINQYQQEIGSIMYLMTKTRPDIAYHTGLLARYMANPSLEHRKWLNKLWLYISYTRDLGLNYQSELVEDLIGYCDSDWGGDIGTRRSTTGYIYLYRGAAIAWNSRLQRTVALSSCEAEYMALKEAIKEQLFVIAIIHEIPWLNEIVLNHSRLFTDSNSAIELAKNPLYHHRTKHIDIQYHFIREKVKEKVINLIFIPTDQQLADGLTKPLDITKTQILVKGLGLARSKSAPAPDIDQGGVLSM